ncbi:hypothetical protein D3C78_1546330 [compost metagenome]
MELEKLWELPDKIPVRKLWKFYYRTDRRVNIEVFADSYDNAWIRLSEVLKGE